LISSCCCYAFASAELTKAFFWWSHCGRQLIIGEDTGSHIANLIWIWDFDHKNLTRIGATPMGSETTSPYWYNIGDWSYMMFVVQHPYGSSTIEEKSSSWAEELGANPAGTCC
jgi:hypothetical protein